MYVHSENEEEKLKELKIKIVHVIIFCTPDPLMAVWWEKTCRFDSTKVYANMMVRTIDRFCKYKI